MAFPAGAGFRPFDMKPAALVSALRLIADGESFIPATLATELAHRADQPRLTRREHDMLSGLRAGLSNKEIADKQQLSEVTVKHHVKSLRGKLGARNGCMPFAVPLNCRSNKQAASDD